MKATVLIQEILRGERNSVILENGDVVKFDYSYNSKGKIKRYYAELTRENKIIDWIYSDTSKIGKAMFSKKLEEYINR